MTNSSALKYLVIVLLPQRNMVCGGHGKNLNVLAFATT